MMRKCSRARRHIALATATATVAATMTTIGAGGVVAQSPPVSPREEATPAIQSSGLPLPRFVSLKSDRVNLRTGPSTEYPTAWVFRRAGLPVEVLKELEGWRQVRDSEGTTGWIAQSFLSGRRTALVLPWEVKPERAAPRVPLLESDSAGARPVVEVEAGVIASIVSCDGQWCEVTVEDYRGVIEQKKLWGVYDREKVK